MNSKATEIALRLLKRGLSEDAIIDTLSDVDDLDESAIEDACSFVYGRFTGDRAAALREINSERGKA
jgi:hypothetical protein